MAQRSTDDPEHPNKPAKNTPNAREQEHPLDRCCAADTCVGWQWNLLSLGKQIQEHDVYGLPNFVKQFPNPQDAIDDIWQLLGPKWHWNWLIYLVLGLSAAALPLFLGVFVEYASEDSDVSMQDGLLALLAVVLISVVGWAAAVSWIHCLNIQVAAALYTACLLL